MITNTLTKIINTEVTVEILLESDIKEKYHTKYQDTRVSYSLAIQKYIDAKTEDERQQAYDAIKSQYENYSKFLETAHKKLGVE